MKRIFVDTSGWIALVNISDSLHSKATDLYHQLFAEGCVFVTHYGVMLEVGNGLSAAKNRRMATGLKRKFDSTSRYELIGFTEQLYEAAWDLFEERPDKDWGMVDCASFVVMKEYEITDALTADKHFEQAGFVRLL